MDWSQLTQPQFWLAVLQIIIINILLSGDNAVVIALACRKLPPRERLLGMVIGAGVSSLLLIVFTIIFASLLRLPYLQVVGGCLLFWIAGRLLVPEDEHAAGTVEAVEDLWRAVRIVVIADVVMSLDNVVAVASAANGSYVLLTLGLCISIPIVIAGAALITALLTRFPILVWVGAALLGWIAGAMLVDDQAVQPYVNAPTTLSLDTVAVIFGPAQAHHLSAEFNLAHFAFGASGALAVLLAGAWLRRARPGPRSGGATLETRPGQARDSA